MSPVPVPESIGRYRIDEYVGGGGMGDVYKGFDPSLDRFVALKTIKPHIKDDTTLDRLFREARACGRLDHPGIIRVYDVSEEHRFIAMEYLEGETLESAIRRNGLSFQQQLNVLIAILDALSYAHSKGVIHRDIKPSNVFLQTNGGVKVLDFGIARVAHTDSLTTTGTVVGTTFYMSPEQMKGQPVDERTDVYSTGVVAYEVFTRRKPFEGTGITEVMLKVLSEEPPPMQTEWSSQFPEIERVVARAMTKSPLERFSSALEMKTELLRFVEAHRGAIAGTQLRPQAAGTDRTVILPRGDGGSAAMAGSVTQDSNAWSQANAAVASGTISFPFDNETQGESRARSAQAGTPAPLPPSPRPVSAATRMRRWMVPAAVVAVVSVGAIVAAQRVLAPDSEPPRKVVIVPKPPKPEPIDPDPINLDPVNPDPVNPSPDPKKLGGGGQSGNLGGGGTSNRLQGRAGLFIDRRQIDGALATELSNALGVTGLAMATSSGTAAWEVVSARVDVTTRPASVFGQTSFVTADYVASLTVRNAATREQKTERFDGNGGGFGEPVARAAALRRAAEEMAQAIEQATK